MLTEEHEMLNLPILRRIMYANIKTTLLRRSILPCKAKRQYLLTCKVSDARCLLTLYGSI